MVFIPWTPPSSNWPMFWVQNVLYPYRNHFWPSPHQPKPWWDNPHTRFKAINPATMGRNETMRYETSRLWTNQVAIQMPNIKSWSRKSEALRRTTRTHIWIKQFGFLGSRILMGRRLLRVMLGGVSRWRAWDACGLTLGGRRKNNKNYK